MSFWCYWHGCILQEVTALLGTEGLHLEFTECPISEIAKVAFSLNSTKVKQTVTNVSY